MGLLTCAQGFYTIWHGRVHSKCQEGKGESDLGDQWLLTQELAEKMAQQAIGMPSLLEFMGWPGLGPTRDSSFKSYM